MDGRGHRVGRYYDRGVAGKRPRTLQRPTATAADGGRRRVRLEARELALDRRIDGFEPAADVPGDLRVHEHGGQVYSHVHVAHEVHPAGRTDVVPRVTVYGEQCHVERYQCQRVPGHRPPVGHVKHGVHAVQLPLNAQQNGVPARGARDRQRAHHALERHLQ